jgi:hypothetical protein
MIAKHTAQISCKYCFFIILLGLAGLISFIGDKDTNYFRKSRDFLAEFFAMSKNICTFVAVILLKR